MRTSKSISMKTITQTRLNYGLMKHVFAAHIALKMTDGLFSVQEHILKQLVVRFLGFLVSLGIPFALGNCPIAFSRISAKNAIGALKAQPMKKLSAFRI